MRKSEMVKFIKTFIQGVDFSRCNAQELNDEAACFLSILEGKGMLPPVQSPSLIDLPDGTQKHGPALNVWDKE
jgi:hypothetical protein